MRGGIREGQGRKSRAEEEQTAKKAIQAIEEKYGSVVDGFKALLESKEPILQRFVWEHAVGKPMDKIKLQGETDNKLEVIVRYEERDNTSQTT